MKGACGLSSVGSSNAESVVEEEKEARGRMKAFGLSRRISLPQDVPDQFDRAWIFLQSIPGELK